MSRSRYEKFKQVLRQRQHDMTLLTDQVHKGQNISAMLRTADAVGIPEIHMVQPSYGHLLYHNTAGGSGRFTGNAVYPDIESGMVELKNRGMHLYAAHWSDRAIDFHTHCRKERRHNPIGRMGAEYRLWNREEPLRSGTPNDIETGHRTTEIDIAALCRLFPQHGRRSRMQTNAANTHLRRDEEVGTPLV